MDVLGSKDAEWADSGAGGSLSQERLDGQKRCKKSKDSGCRSS